MTLTSESKKDQEYHVPNLERALHIFELLSQYPSGISISETATKLNIPRNSVHRIMMTLAGNGYLARDEDSRNFRLTKKLLIIGYAAFKEKKLVEYSLDEMRTLRNNSKETVALGVISSGEGVVIEQVSGLHMFKFVLQPGKSFHLHTAAPAKAILAFLPENEMKTLIGNMSFQRFNKNTITNADIYNKVLKQTYSQGFAEDIGEEYEGMYCVGAPILDQHSYPVAAIWITGPAERLKPEKRKDFAIKVKESAKKISAKLGYGINETLRTKHL